MKILRCWRNGEMKILRCRSIRSTATTQPLKYQLTNTNKLFYLPTLLQTMLSFFHHHPHPITRQHLLLYHPNQRFPSSSSKLLNIKTASNQLPHRRSFSFTSNTSPRASHTYREAFTWFSSGRNFSHHLQMVYPSRSHHGRGGLGMLLLLGWAVSSTVVCSDEEEVFF